MIEEEFQSFSVGKNILPTQIFFANAYDN